MSNRPRTRRRFPFVPVAVGVVIAVIAVVAVLVTTLGDDEGAEPVSGGSGSPTTIRQTAEVEVRGTSLAPFESGAADPAIGKVAPTLQGTTFDGSPVAVNPGAGPTLVLFVAHWCPHCQAEIPRLTEPFRSLPSGTSVVTVSTGVKAQAPNYPPSQWFEKERWPTPVLADDGNSRAAQAYGLTGYPFFVFLDRGGKVVERTSGERPVQQVMSKLRELGAAA